MTCISLRSGFWLSKICDASMPQFHTYPKLHSKTLVSHEVVGRPVLGGLLTYLTLSSSSNHIRCMIINCSLHGYIRTMPAPLRNILLFFVFLLSLRLAQMCVHYPWNTVFTPVMHHGPLCKYVIMFMSMLEYEYLALLWENINNDTLNTSRWNATMIDPCTCGYSL